MISLPLRPPVRAPVRAPWPQPTWPGTEPMVSPMLARTLLLAVLLHVWLVLLLGSAPGGTARPGQGVWGAINVTLRGPETPGVAETALPPVPSGPAGEAETPRWGGAVREAAPAPRQAPGAARLGEWAATPAPAPPAPVLPVEPAERSERVPPIERMAPALARPVAPPLPELPRPMPLPTEATLAELPVGQRSSPSLSAPVAAAPLPVLPAPAPALAEMPPPPSLSSLAPVPAAARAPALVAPLPALQTAPTLPALAAVPMPAPMPAPLAEPLQRLPPAVAAAPDTVAPLQPARSVPLAEVQALPMAPALNAVPALAKAPGGAGALDAGSQVGRDVATPPSGAASVLPRLNLQLARPRGGELSRFSSPGVLQLMPRPPELPDKLGKEIAKSAKEDCRTAHQGAGLLAVVPLAADALKKDGGCKW